MPGHTEIDRAGAMPGDRGAFDVHNYPEEHASDTHEGVSILHLDPDAAEGEAMVMGAGGVYVATDIVTAAELPHVVLSATHTDTDPDTLVRGDLLVAIGATPKLTRYALSVPAAGTLNYLGINNGETEPTWKSASANPGAAAAILATDARGRLSVQNLGVGLVANATYAIGAMGTHDSTSGDAICLYGYENPAPTGASSAYYVGLFGRVLINQAYNYAFSGSVTGVYAAADFRGASLATGYGLRVAVACNNSTNSPTAATLYGAHINVFTAGFSSVTTAYGLYVDNVAATTAYAIYTNAGAVRFGDKVGIGLMPTAMLTLKAGTATASTAPLKFTSGTLLTTPEAGAVEFLTDNLHLTITTGAARKGIVLDDGTRLTSGKMPVATTNGRLIDLTPQANEADAKADYTAGDLDTEAEIISALNATNTTINSLIAKLEALGLLATS
jgi:hypothetical protein